MTLESHRWRRTLLAAAVAAMGVVDILSALLSHPPDRLVALRHLVPTTVLDSSRTFTLLAGALLLVTAWGLRRGKRRAFVAALLLCAVSVPVNLLKAFDVEEATVAAGLMFALGLSGEAFTVESHALTLAALRSRALGAIAALIAYAIAGGLVVEALTGARLSVRDAAAETLARAFGIGGPVFDVPAGLPHGRRRIIEWYESSLPLLGLCAAVGLGFSLLRPAAHRRRHVAEAREVAALLRTHGDSSVGWFALEPDADYFFSRNRRAVIAYRFESDTLLAIGDPIGPPDEAGPLIEDFARYARGNDWQFAFFQARPERLTLYENAGLRALHIGEDAVLWTERFTLEGGAIGSVRRSARKAEEAGVEVRHFVPGVEPCDRAHAPDGWLEQLGAISAAWLASRHGSEKGFCMGRFDPATLAEVWVSVAWRPATGRIEAFTTWVPIPARRGWCLDLMRRRADSTGGAMELLVVRAVEAARARGDAMVSLALSALASVEAGPTAPGEQELARARAFLIEHLARFYDFQGLFAWKKKFAPDFEDRYLVLAGPFALPRVVLALVRAQSPGGLRGYLWKTGPPGG